MIKISPVPDESYKSHDFVITVNGINLDAYKCRVSRIPFNRVWPGYQRPDQTEMASFAYLAADEGGVCHHSKQGLQ